VNPKNFDKIDEELNIHNEIIDENTSIISKNDNEKKSHSSIIDIKKDYEYTRANLYSLVEKGQEAIDGMMELASETGQPRAYEVAGQLIKSVSDVTDKLMDLQKKLKDIEGEDTKTTNNVTNNAVFVGSTSDLSKLLKQGFLNNKEQ
jgi:seryl-tRNA synthetase